MEKNGPKMDQKCTLVRNKMAIAVQKTEKKKGTICIKIAKNGGKWQKWPFIVHFLRSI